MARMNDSRIWPTGFSDASDSRLTGASSSAISGEQPLPATGAGSDGWAAESLRPKARDRHGGVRMNLESAAFELQRCGERRQFLRAQCEGRIGFGDLQIAPTGSLRPESVMPRRWGWRAFPS